MAAEKDNKDTGIWSLFLVIELLPAKVRRCGSACRVTTRIFDVAALTLRT